MHSSAEASSSPCGSPDCAIASVLRGACIHWDRNSSTSSLVLLPPSAPSLWRRGRGHDASCLRTGLNLIGPTRDQPVAQASETAVSSSPTLRPSRQENPASPRRGSSFCAAQLFGRSRKRLLRLGAGTRRTHA